MRLKSLILSGFKSFPRRTVINFSQGVSAVVGPNGSGKSNIVDAIRWVLGEQNPRMLRAERMEDLIFSGNSKFVPDAARVKLRLEQCQDLAPPELKNLSEIEIERVLFRDGASKFLLNGKTCRLKEIRYLFLDTGTGARAYSIIDQGRVGQFVTMTPDERRAIIEEAAGIARYRERRIQALSRMKTTLENLERLEDVIAEVRRQRNSLKRQAAKAEKYTELRKTEDRLGLLILKAKYDRLQKEREILVNSLREKEQKKAGIAAELSALDLELSSLDMELEGLFSDSKRYRKKEETAKEEQDRCLKLISRLEKDLALINQEEEALKKETKKLHYQIEGLKRGIERCNNQWEEIRRLLEKTKKESKEQERQVSHQDSSLTRLKNRREKIKDQFVVTASNRAAIFEKLSSLEEKRDNLQLRLERMAERRGQLAKEKEDLLEKIKDTKGRLVTCEDSLEKVRQTLDGKKDELSSLLKEMDGIYAKKRDLSSQLSEMDARYKALKRLEQEGVGLTRGIRLLKKELGQEAEIVADLIQVEDGYEDIVEIALGITLQALVVNESRTITSVIERIKDGEKELHGISFLMDGRKVFIETDKNMPEKGLCLGSKVSGSDVANETVRSMLNNWFLVDSVEDILDSSHLETKGNQGFFMISRDGFILTPWNEVRHVFSESNEAGIIYRKKELRNLAEKLKGLRSLLEEIGREEKRLGEKKERLNLDVKRLTKEIRRLEDEKKRLDDSLLKLGSRLEGLEDRLELMIFEEEETRDELSGISPEIDKLEKELHQAQKEEASLKEELLEIDKRYSLEESRLKELLKARDRLMLKEQELAGKLRNVESEKKRLEAALSRARDSLEGKKKRVSQLKDKKNDLDAELNTLGEKLSQIKKAVGQITAKLIDIEDDIEGLRDKRLSVERKKGEKQKVLSNIQGEIGKIKIRLSEIDKNLEHLTEVCQEQFRRSLNDVIADKDLETSQDITSLKEELRKVSNKLESFGPVNLMAVEEFKELDERLGFLCEQKEDVQNSLKDIEDAIERIDRECKEKFTTALKTINESLNKVFPLLFNGGKAWLALLDEKNVLESGVEYRIRLPGKPINRLSLLSGGEKALAALALIFAIFFVKPTPFCLLDEVDAPLDEANTLKFNRLVKEVSLSSQVILVTHNQQVMEMADALYGVTMEEKGVSKLVSVKMV